ncbi:unnamed protein product [Pseudo-nitzschia multistriata]|uniref:DUF1995 domain-containing protein n=1 Tax=Pseudo-nitzschia multistriata TaxID=183589 RepID=A0A448ZE71_9STRA|nr:unnamed protein product [Pseudo-nitzschia multistriata]
MCFGKTHSRSFRSRPSLYRCWTASSTSFSPAHHRSTRWAIKSALTPRMYSLSGPLRITSICSSIDCLRAEYSVRSEASDRSSVHCLPWLDGWRGSKPLWANRAAANASQSVLRYALAASTRSSAMVPLAFRKRPVWIMNCSRWSVVHSSSVVTAGMQFSAVRISRGKFGFKDGLSGHAKNRIAGRYRDNPAFQDMLARVSSTRLVQSSILATETAGVCPPFLILVMDDDVFNKEYKGNNRCATGTGKTTQQRCSDQNKTTTTKSERNDGIVLDCGSCEVANLYHFCILLFKCQTIQTHWKMRFSNPSRIILLVVSLALVGRISAFTTTTTPASSPRFSVALSVSPNIADIDQPTDLPDSLVDAAERAANSCASFAQYAPEQARCRVDFDTNAGDETYPLLKTSTEFMQNFVSFLSYKLVPGLQAEKMAEVQRVAEARVALQRILQQEEGGEAVDQDEKQCYIEVLQNNGKEPGASGSGDDDYKGPIVRVYFPDEGNAALAKRDWTQANGVDMPSCVRFGACGGIRSITEDLSRDVLIFFFCPKASESDMVEEILQKTEQAHLEANTGVPLLSVFVNPNLVDMGVTGFGMAGRMLRERLLDGLEGTYYLRTLQWGALTRSWPRAYTLWEENESAEGGYQLMRTLPYLPSNPEVEDIYDAVNEGKLQVDENGNEVGRKPPSALDQFGDFVQGMMRL